MTLVYALILDALFGEPKWLWSRAPHPAVLMGCFISQMERWLNQGENRRLKGVFLLIVILGGALGVSQLVTFFLGTVGEVVVCAILIAQRSLVEHVRAVSDALRLSDLEARRPLSYIVSRDTSQMQGPDIARSAIESAAENMSDGVIAPAFWFALLGLPGVIAYKWVNTADSMVGYMIPRYKEFGWAAARFDDVLNYIPARLSAVLMGAACGCYDIWAWRDDARKHKSVNAGWTEAAMAHGLGVSLSGPRSYDGRRKVFPFVNVFGRKNLGPEDIDTAISVLWRSWWGLVLLSLSAALACHYGSMC